ncbi:MAG: hypothetical protein ACI9S8_001789 [Chlamydiales bacterium]|jgi:hypothetical protein
MMTKLLLLIITFLSLTSFLGFFEEPSYIQMANRITNSYNRTLKKNHGLQVIGSGGAMMDNVKKINLHYTAYKRLSIQEARTLYIEVIEGLLEKVNTDDKLRPFLHNYPFEIKNLDISIRFEDSPGTRVPEDYVAFIFNNKDEIVFSAYRLDPDARDKIIDGKYYPLHKETYEEALRIEQGEQ